MEVATRSKTPIVGILVSLLFGVIVAWTFAGLARYSLVAPPGFDGAMNLKTAASFLHGQGYGFFYDSFFSFPAQTDGPFILPAAVAFWLGGITPFTSQVVNLLYVAALVVVTVVLLRRVGVPLWLALFGIMACMSMPGFVEYSMNGYGEVPVLVWFLWGLALLAPGGTRADPSCGRLFAVGLLFGMAYLTKVVALVCVGPAMAALGVVILMQPGRFRRLVALSVGFAAPVVAWEIFRLIELGSARAYMGWWRFQIGQIRSQSGAQHADAAEGFLRKGFHHLSILADLTGVSAPWLAVCIVAPIVIGLIVALDRKGNRNRRLVVGMLATVVGLYFFWWLFISPTAMTWLRRIIDGLLLLQCLVVAVLATVFSRSPEAAGPSKAQAKGPRALMLLVMIPVVVAQLQLIRSGESVTRPPEPPSYALDMFRIVDKVRALPADATIYGAGWWQAPVISLFAQRQFMNFDHWTADRLNAVQDKYFVTDMYTEGISQSSIQNVLDESQSSMLIKLNGGALYKLGSVQPYPPFTSQDSDPANLSSELDFSHADYSHRRGIFQRESDRDAWVGVDAAVMLKRSNENILRMTIELPGEFIKGLAPKQPTVHITSPGCLDQTLPLGKEGVQTIQLPLTCDSWQAPKAFQVNLVVSDHVPFIPQIDADNRLRTFRLRSMELIEAPSKS
jgi:hypothetical protein